MWQYSTSLHLLSVHMYQVRAKCFPHNTCIFLSLILNSGPQIPNGYSASQFLRHLLRCFPLSHSLQWWFHTWVFSNPNSFPRVPSQLMTFFISLEIRSNQMRSCFPSFRHQLTSTCIYTPPITIDELSVLRAKTNSFTCVLNPIPFHLLKVRFHQFTSLSYIINFFIITGSTHQNTNSMLLFLPS